MSLSCDSAPQWRLDLAPLPLHSGDLVSVRHGSFLVWCLREAREQKGSAEN